MSDLATLSGILGNNIGHWPFEERRYLESYRGLLLVKRVLLNLWGLEALAENVQTITLDLQSGDLMNIRRGTTPF